MNTGNANFVRHIYKENKVLKSYTVYILDEVDPNKNLLTEFIRIEPFLNMTKATNFNKYFRIKNKSSWLKSNLITGLKPTSTKGLFYGDTTKIGIFGHPKKILIGHPKKKLIGHSKKVLIVFYYIPNSDTLIIDVYKDDYPYNDYLLQGVLKEFKINLKQ